MTVISPCKPGAAHRLCLVPAREGKLTALIGDASAVDGVPGRRKREGRQR